ncbi:hypothetical protein H0176_27780 [Methylorubrum populi]|uniref:Uncharacterized protein n=1 Tax=Methylorubrum rhodesianum TaxID=29427 RepID=A0ABU9Z4Q6_9HYPH|nr:hypothetical protein [Methylorubrum rhodesianum]MBK3404972.1 hypothetical protein [Methylorubrum rhodesianum]MBY0144017.1 hypothetical protein [Methylorubrum populi]
MDGASRRPSGAGIPAVGTSVPEEVSGSADIAAEAAGRPPRAEDDAPSDLGIRARSYKLDSSFWRRCPDVLNLPRRRTKWIGEVLEQDFGSNA